MADPVPASAPAAAAGTVSIGGDLEVNRLGFGAMRVTASLLVIFAQLGIERAVYESSVRLHRMVSGELIIVPYGFKSMQLHAEVPVAVTDIIATNPSVSSYSPFWFGVMSLQHASMPTSRARATSSGHPSTTQCTLASAVLSACFGESSPPQAVRTHLSALALNNI
jgi:hypothetical protein